MMEAEDRVSDPAEVFSALAEAERRDPVLLRFVRAFLEGNYFYVLSAVLMMLGCYWLMPISIAEAEQFERRLKALLLLQGYEVLVIATAVTLVFHLRTLGDAFTLFIVELVLLLDPTCFSNAFFTLKTVSGGMVNVICLALVPVKLGVLQHCLQLRVAPRAFAALLLTALFVYLGEGPLNLARFSLSHFSYFSILTWGTFIVMLVFPPVERTARLVSDLSEFSSERQRSWLRLYILVIPLLVVGAHLAETLNVYDIPLFPLFLTPLLLTMALLFVKVVPSAEDNEGFLVILDVFVLCALIVSAPGTNAQVNTSVPQSFRPPDWVLSSLPLAAWGLAAILVYGYAFLRWGRATAFYRIGAILAGGILYCVFRTGVPARVGSFGHDHPLVVLFFVWLVATTIACRVRYFWTWLVAATFGIVFIVARMAMWKILLFPEGIQALFLVLIVLYHNYGDPRNERYTSAFIVAGVALGRLIVDPGWWQGCVVGLETIGFFVAAWMLRQYGYLVIGALQGCLFFAYVGKRVVNLLSPGLVAISASLALFAVGVLVSFQKKRLMMGVERGATHLRGASNRSKEPPSAG